MSPHGGVFGGMSSVGHQIQKPTKGRIVHFYSLYQDRVAGPYTALIVGVNALDNINLAVWNEQGESHPEVGVLLVQDHEPKPNAGKFCVWPPKV